MPSKLQVTATSFLCFLQECTPHALVLQDSNLHKYMWAWCQLVGLCGELGCIWCRILHAENSQLQLLSSLRKPQLHSRCFVANAVHIAQPHTSCVGRLSGTVVALKKRRHPAKLPQLAANHFCSVVVEIVCR